MREGEVAVKDREMIGEEKDLLAKFINKMIVIVLIMLM